MQMDANDKYNFDDTFFIFLFDDNITFSHQFPFLNNSSNRLNMDVSLLFPISTTTRLIRGNYFYSCQNFASKTVINFEETCVK